MHCFFFLLSSNDKSPREFIDFSEALETVGASAYTGGIQYISDDVGSSLFFPNIAH